MPTNLYQTISVENYLTSVIENRNNVMLVYMNTADSNLKIKQVMTR